MVNIKRAVALSYRPEEDEAPRLLAKGERLMAERMIEAARDAGITIIEDAALATSLARLDLGERIPVELYQAVAEVLAFVYHVDDRYGKQRLPPPKGGSV